MNHKNITYSYKCTKYKYGKFVHFLMFNMCCVYLIHCSSPERVRSIQHNYDFGYLFEIVAFVVEVRFGTINQLSFHFIFYKLLMRYDFLAQPVVFHKLIFIAKVQICLKLLLCTFIRSVEVCVLFCFFVDQMLK